MSPVAGVCNKHLNFPSPTNLLYPRCFSLIFFKSFSPLVFVLPWSSLLQRTHYTRTKRRVIKSGGAVFKFFGEGPMRIFVRGQMTPGICPSRTLGDGLATTIGVIPEPEVRLEFRRLFYLRKEDLTLTKTTSHQKVNYRKIQDDDSVLIIASDGLWDVANNQEAIDICMSHHDASVAAHDLQRIATTGNNVDFEINEDNVTVQVIFLNDPIVKVEGGGKPCEPLSFTFVIAFAESHAYLPRTTGMAKKSSGMYHHASSKKKLKPVQVRSFYFPFASIQFLCTCTCEHDDYCFFSAFSPSSSLGAVLTLHHPPHFTSRSHNTKSSLRIRLCRICTMASFSPKRSWRSGTLMKCGKIQSSQSSFVSSKWDAVKRSCGSWVWATNMCS